VGQTNVAKKGSLPLLLAQPVGVSLNPATTSCASNSSLSYALLNDEMKGTSLASMVD
jgi:hypothetical protein